MFKCTPPALLEFVSRHMTTRIVYMLGREIMMRVMMQCCSRWIHHPRIVYHPSLQPQTNSNPVLCVELEVNAYRRMSFPMTPPPSGHTMSKQHGVLLHPTYTSKKTKGHSIFILWWWSDTVLCSGRSDRISHVTVYRDTSFS